MYHNLSNPSPSVFWHSFWCSDVHADDTNWLEDGGANGYMKNYPEEDSGGHGREQTPDLLDVTHGSVCRWIMFGVTARAD